MLYKRSNHRLLLNGQQSKCIKGQRVRGKGPISKEGKKEMKPFNPASVTHMCLHRLRVREAGGIQPRQSDKKKRPAQNQCEEPSPAPTLTLSRGGGVGLRKKIIG